MTSARAPDSVIPRVGNSRDHNWGIPMILDRPRRGRIAFALAPARPALLQRHEWSSPAVANCTSAHDSYRTKGVTTPALAPVHAQTRIQVRPRGRRPSRISPIAQTFAADRRRPRRATSMHRGSSPRRQLDRALQGGRENESDHRQMRAFRATQVAPTSNGKAASRPASGSRVRTSLTTHSRGEVLSLLLCGEGISFLGD